VKNKVDKPRGWPKNPRSSIAAELAPEASIAVLMRFSLFCFEIEEPENGESEIEIYAKPGPH
jgi:hypothetical protein